MSSPVLPHAQEDLDTLALLSKILPEYAQGCNEEAVARAAFNVVFAFDEVVCCGIKETLTLQQVSESCLVCAV